MRGYSVLLSGLVVLFMARAGAHEARPPEPGSCAEAVAQPWAQKTIIVDANAIVEDPRVMTAFPGATMVVTATLLQELDGLKTKPGVGPNPRKFMREFASLLREQPADGEIKLENGTRVVFDDKSYKHLLRNTDYDPAIPDNRYLATAIHYQQQKKGDVILLTDDNNLTLKAASRKIEVKSFREHARPERAISEEGLPLVEITDAEMEVLLVQNRLPRPADLAVKPNQFVQFHSPSFPAMHESVARYKYVRPEPVYENGPFKGTPPTEFKIEREILGAVRVLLNNDLVPELGEGVSDGWYLDAHTNTVHLVGSWALKMRPQSKVQILAQTEPHRMERLLSFEELGLWSLTSRSLEQTMAVNLALDESITLLVEEGKLGTSKTFIFVVAALKLHERDQNLKVLLTRAPTPMGGHGSGYLPGTAEEKNLPWMDPVLDNLMTVEAARGNLRGNKPKRQKPTHWEVQDYGQIRGRSLTGTLIGIDEYQNTTEIEADALLGRGADGSRFIISGDVSQVDPPRSPDDNGLAYVIRMLGDEQMSDEQRSYLAHIELKKSVRSPFSELISELAKRHRRRR